MTRLRCIVPSERVGEHTKTDGARDEVVEFDATGVGIPFHDDVESLWCEVVTPGSDCGVKFVRFNGSGTVTVVLHEGVLPSVQCRPQLFEFIESHLAREIAIQHTDHNSTTFNAEGLI